MNARPATDIETAIAEYNTLGPLERAYWHGAADSARPCDAWAAWKARQPQTPDDGGQEVRRSE